MKTQPSPTVDWAQLYGRLAEAVDYAGFDITPNSDATILTLTPREPLPPSPAGEKWHSPLAKVAAVYGFTGTWEQIADALIAARQPLGQEPVGVVDDAVMTRSSRDLPGEGRYISSVKMSCELPPGTKLYAGPPAQPVDLEQFREAVLCWRREQLSRTTYLPEAEPSPSDNVRKADQLLALIDKGEG